MNGKETSGNCGIVWSRPSALNDGPLLNTASLRLGDPSASPAGRDPSHRFLPDPAGDAAVLNCLRQAHFDMQATAKTLGWDRSTVTQRLKGLCFQALVDAGGDQTTAALAIAGDARHARTVELKLMDYHRHLMSVIEPFSTAERRSWIANGDSRTCRTGTSPRSRRWCASTSANHSQDPQA